MLWHRWWALWHSFLRSIALSTHQQQTAGLSAIRQLTGGADWPGFKPHNQYVNRLDSVGEQGGSHGQFWRGKLPDAPGCTRLSFITGRFSRLVTSATAVN